MYIPLEQIISLLKFNIISMHDGSTNSNKLENESFKMGIGIFNPS